MLKEHWKPIPGFEGEYEVSDWGWVRSLKNGLRHIAQELDSHGYYAVRLYRAGVRIRRRVHVLVAAAFHGPKPTECLCVHHRDGVKTNNHVWNLEYTTLSENTKHAARESFLQVGVLKPVRMFLDHAEILLKYNSDVSIYALAREYNVSDRTIGRIVKGTR